MSFSRSFISLFSFLALTACQHHKVVDGESINSDWLSDNSAFNDRQLTFSELPTWQFSAKVAVLTPELQEQANMVWRYGDQSNNIRLYGPLGAGQVQLDFDQYGVQLSDNKGVLHRGENAEELLSRIIGWPIPVNALSHWLFVLPEPNSSYEYQLDDSGNVTVLRQLGWQIMFKDYRDYGGVFLPRKLTAEKLLLLKSDQKGKTNQKISVKLITKSWKLKK